MTLLPCVRICGIRRRDLIVPLFGGNRARSDNKVATPFSAKSQIITLLIVYTPIDCRMVSEAGGRDAFTLAMPIRPAATITRREHGFPHYFERSGAGGANEKCCSAKRKFRSDRLPADRGCCVSQQMHCKPIRYIDTQQLRLVFHPPKSIFIRKALAVEAAAISIEQLHHHLLATWSRVGNGINGVVDS